MPEDGPVETETLADAIRRLRGDMTQEQFAAYVGISSSMIGHVEAGRRSLGVASLEQIEQALNLDQQQRATLREARNQASNRTSSPPGGGGVSLEQHMALHRDVEQLAEQVRVLGAEVARLSRSKRRGAQ